MQETTAVRDREEQETAVRDPEESEERPAHLIVGVTPGEDLIGLVETLHGMGGRRLTLVETQIWQAAMEGRHGINHAFLKSPTHEDARSETPLLLPVQFGDVDQHSLLQVLESIDSAALLLFYGRPDRLVSKALETNTDIGSALRKWSEASRCLLDVVHRYRTRSLLLNFKSASKGTPAFRQVCQERFGLKDRHVEVPSSFLDTESEVQRAIACQIVAQSSEIQDLLSELEASAEPIDLLPRIPEIDCEKAIEEWRSRSETQQADEEKELLRLQLNQVQKELESNYLRALEAEAKLTAKDEALAELKKAIRDKERKYKAASLRVKQLKQELANAVGTLAGIRKSLSWRLTRPLREARSLVKRFSTRVGGN